MFLKWSGSTKSPKSLCEEIKLLILLNIIVYLRLFDAIQPFMAVTLAFPFIPAVAVAQALASAAMELAYPSRCFGTTPGGNDLLARWKDPFLGDFLIITFPASDNVGAAIFHHQDLLCTGCIKTNLLKKLSDYFFH